MYYYPTFLELSGQSYLVVGTSVVGCREIASLPECSIKRFHIIGLAKPGTSLQVLLEDKHASLTERSFTSSDMEGRTLVSAATSSRQTNNAVARACTERGTLYNCADVPKDSSLIVPALTEQGNIATAFSAGDAGPALARRICGDLKTWLGERCTGIGELLMRLRPLVLVLHHGARQGTTLFRNIVDSPLFEVLQRRGRQTRESLLRELLSTELYLYIMELLHDLT